MKRLKSSLFLFILIATNAFADGRQFLPDSAKFTAAGQFFSEPDNPIVRQGDWEEGIHEGLTYKMFRNGSGEIGGWDLLCSSDGMDDSRTCLLKKDDLVIVVGEHGLLHIFIGHKHFPGKGVMLRVDGTTPLTATWRGWHGATAQKIYRRLLTAKAIVTRFYQWPSEAAIDTDTDPAGLQQARELADWAIRASNKKSRPRH